MAARGRRRNSYWEPMYREGLGGQFNDHNWDFTQEKGPNCYTFSSQAFPISVKFLKIENVNFSFCDFSGDFHQKLLFVNCVFSYCDFGLTTFRKAKFTKCEFIKTSFTQSSFLNCELRDCSYDKIGVSGNETILDGTLITNPRDFVNAAYTNTTNVPPDKSKFEQLMRLEETKSIISRILLSILKKEGSEKVFYEAVMVATIQESLANIASSRLDIHRIKAGRNFNLGNLWKVGFSILSLLGGAVDLGILYIFGLINAWGASLSRPALVGGGMLLSYGCYYTIFCEVKFLVGLKAAAEILLLFGYTNYASKWQAEGVNLVIFTNAIAGVIWYIVAVPTVVNKLTRVRG